MTTSLPRKLAGGTLTIMLAAMAAWQAGAAVFARSDPMLVHALDPSHPRALSAVVDLRSAGANSLKAPTAADAALLRKSLAREPLSSRALRQLSQAEAAAGRDASAKALLASAGKISRRDEFAQVLLAREAALANDLGGAVRHLDAALSGSRQADARVFPLLARLLANKEFRGAAAPYLDRVWGEPFLLYAAQNAPPGHVLDLVSANPNVQKRPRYERFRSELIHHLANKGLPAQAIAYARLISPRPADLNEPGFTKATLAPGLAPATWRAQNTGGTYVSLTAEGLIVSADASARGQVLERLFVLRPGAHRMRVVARGIVNPGQLTGIWAVACVQPSFARSLAQATNEIGREWRADLMFSVPDGCKAVRVTLEVINFDDQNSSEAQVSRFSLTGQVG